ncbi:MAG: hypothetical protein ACYSUI_19015 [Planctomycetota bacterium]|jgi:hypothetical protein
MKYKTLFRLLLKLLGVYFFVDGVVNGGLYFWWGVAVPAGALALDWSYVVPGVWQLIPVVFGIYLFFGGKRIVDWAIPSNRPYCPECGYDLSGAANNRCTECGTPFDWKDIQPARTDVSAVDDTQPGRLQRVRCGA